MELRRELVLTIGGLVVLNLLLAFGAVGLFVRMGPAIERILQENVCSITAAEEILAELAMFGSESLSPDARTRVRKLLQDAQQNVTEDEERPVLASIEHHLSAAMDGDVNARRQLIGDLRRVIQINRDAMHVVDQEARRLGSAGAWAAVFVGFMSFLLSLLVVVRLQTRFVRPLVELYDVLDNAHHGNGFRRCHLFDAPREVVQVTQSVNLLLDERVCRSNHQTDA